MTWRAFLASWIGAATGHLAGAGGVLEQKGALEVFLADVFAHSWTIFLFVSGFLAVSSIYALVPFLWHAPTTTVFKRFGFIPTRTNYFLSGLWAALTPWAAFLVMAGFKVDVAGLRALGG